MAFDDSALALIGYGAGQKLWLYKTTDAKATFTAANYFLNTGEASLAKANDIILVVGATGGTATMEVLAIQTISATASAVTTTNRTT